MKHERMESTNTLFEEARRLTRQATAEAQKQEESRWDALGAARERLTERVLDGFEERVREAARLGLQEVDAYTFEGTELVDGFFTLFLLKGPRKEGDSVAVSHGGVPVLKSLRSRLFPFKARHQWVEGTLHNRVIVSWGH